MSVQADRQYSCWKFKLWASLRALGCCLPRDHGPIVAAHPLFLRLPREEGSGSQRGRGRCESILILDPPEGWMEGTSVVLK
jgi:hypothetical protein